MIMGKKITAWLLAAGLILGTLGGCQKNGVQTGKDSMEKNPAQTESSASGQGESTAKGRYRETEVDLPGEAKGQSFIQLMKGEEGNLELYTAQRAPDSGLILDAFRYVCRDGSWEQDADWEVNQTLKDLGIDLWYITYGGDHRYYISGTDEDYRYHLYRLDEGGKAQELLAEVFQPEEGRDYGMLPPKFEVLENEDILLYDFYQIDVYEPSGRLRYSMAKDFSGTTSDARGFSGGDELVTMQEDAVVKYSLKDGTLMETIPADELKGSRSNMELFGDGEGGVYAANENGLAHISRGGTLWEVLIDGSLNHMGMRSLYLRRFLEGEDKDYYGVFVNGEKGIMMFHYVYDPEMAAVPPQTITVYSLKDHSTVRQAASLFQSQHPDVKVEVRTAVEDGGEVTEEMIQGLNTELLAGQGADVLILDGLPASSYMEKGILMDLREVTEELEQSGDIPANIMEGFYVGDGGIYQIPARMGFPVLIGEEKAVKAYESLEAMAGYQGEKPLAAVENYENLLRMTASLRYRELFRENGGPDREKLIRYLEAVKAVGKASGAKNSFSEEEMERDMATNYVADSGIIGSAIQYDMGRCDSGITQLDGFGDLCIPAQVRVQNPGSLMVPAGEVYFPSVLAGVNRFGGNEEMAVEFVRCLLSFDVQKEELYDGFPVNKKALDAMAGSDKPGYSVSSGYGDYVISAPWPSAEIRREVVRMMEELAVPVLTDETVMKMIVEGAKMYLEDKEDVNQAADQIMRKLSVYQAE